MAMMKLLSLHAISSRLGVRESEAAMVYAKRQNGLVTLPHCPRHSPHY
jgi:hypothetical protein